jgi:hypothetical protein
VLAGVVAAILLNGPPLLVLVQRAGGLESFAQNLLQSQRAWQGAVDPSTQVFGVDAPGLLGRLLGARLPVGVYLAVSLAVLAAAAGALRSTTRLENTKFDHLSATVICLGILLSVHHHAYDLVLLVAPIVALVKGSLPGAFLMPWRRVSLLTLFALLGLNYVTTLSVLHHFEQYQRTWLLLASLNGIFLLLIFLAYVAPAIADSGGLASTPAGPASNEPDGQQ